MKKQFMVIGVFLTFGLGFSQNSFPTATGTNVGIGTTSPSARLEVTSTASGTSGVKLTNLTSASAAASGNSRALSVDASGNVILTPVLNTAPTTENIYNTDGTLNQDRNVTMDGRNLTFTASNASSELFVSGTSGRVAIGSVTPFANLDVKGGLANGTIFDSTDEMYEKSMVFNFGSYVNKANQRRNFTFYDIPQNNFKEQSEVHLAIEDREDYNRFRFVAHTGGDTWLGLTNRVQEEIFTVFENGADQVQLYLPKENSFLGIGTDNFTDGTDIYRLSVKGAVRAERVKVYTTWADFVFEKDYNLPTLEEVEKQIKENGHLKDIPSAKEVEANGIELGEMNKKLLQKIEELTLYIIDMNKELQEVKSNLEKR